VPAPFCTEPDCSLGNCRVLLKRDAVYSRDGRREQFSCELQGCKRCDMGFVNPVPNEDVLACFYTGDYAYFQAEGEQQRIESRSLKYKVARLRYLDLLNQDLASRFASFGAALVERLAGKTITFTLGVPLTLPKNSRILDYGYGTGLWLLSMQLLGWSHLTGYDIASNAQRGEELAARGIQVIPPGGLQNLPSASFDCVRLEHVFEHLADPLESLRSLHRILRPGGLLLMTFPTIYPWLGVADLAASPFVEYLHFPIHLAHHSVESAWRLVGAAGFEKIASRITARELFMTLAARKPASCES